MPREPEDVFFKEFLIHPAWEGVFRHLYRLADDYRTHAANATRETIDYQRGLMNGVFEAIAAIKTLIATKG